MVEGSYTPWGIREVSANPEELEMIDIVAIDTPTCATAANSE